MALTDPTASTPHSILRNYFWNLFGVMLLGVVAGYLIPHLAHAVFGAIKFDTSRGEFNLDPRPMLEFYAPVYGVLTLMSWIIYKGTGSLKGVVFAVLAFELGMSNWTPPDFFVRALAQSLPLPVAARDMLGDVLLSATLLIFAFAVERVGTAYLQLRKQPAAGRPYLLVYGVCGVVIAVVFAASAIWGGSLASRQQRQSYAMHLPAAQNITASLTRVVTPYVASKLHTQQAYVFTIDYPTIPAPDSDRPVSDTVTVAPLTSHSKNVRSACLPYYSFYVSAWLRPYQYKSLPNGMQYAYAVGQSVAPDPPGSPGVYREEVYCFVLGNFSYTLSRPISGQTPVASLPGPANFVPAFAEGRKAIYGCAKDETARPREYCTSTDFATYNRWH